MIALAPLPTLVEKPRAMNSSQENENKLIRMCGSSLAHAIAGPASAWFAQNVILAPGYSFTREFEPGLDLVLDGIEARLPRPR